MGGGDERRKCLRELVIGEKFVYLSKCFLTFEDKSVNVKL